MTAEDRRLSPVPAGRTDPAERTSVSVRCVLYNYEDGGFRDGRYDFGPLQDALAETPDRPDLLFYCEGKHFAANGYKGLLLAAKALSDRFSQPYIPLLGHMERGPMPPVLFYNPTLLTHLPPWYGHGSNTEHDFGDQRNIARFAVRGTGGPDRAETEFLAGVDHWEPLYGPARQLAARRWGRYGRDAKLPAVLAGDTNCSPSGPHWAQRNWDLAAELDWPNAVHKGRQDEYGTWHAATEPMDDLIGLWVPEPGASSRDAAGVMPGRRVGGAGFTSLAELAWLASRAEPDLPRPGLLDPYGQILPTVHPGVDAGGGLHIDNAIVNELMLPYVDVDSYQIHTEAPGVPRRSDHCAVSWRLRF